MAAFLRCFRLGHQSLWIDEAFSLGMAVVGRPLTGAQLLEDIHGPLYTIVLHAWAALAGNSEWALRFPAALLGVATVPLLGWVASMWLGRKVAVPAMWLAAGSPFLVWYGQEARNYALVIFCSCASAAALLSLRRRLAVGGIVAYWLTAAAGMLSNFSFAFLAPLHLAWWLGEPGHRVRRLWLGAAVVALLGLAVSPWLPQVRTNWSLPQLWPGSAQEGPALRGETTFHPGAVPFALHSFAVGYTLGPSLRELKQGPPTIALRRYLPEVFAVTVVFGALGALGLAALARRRRLLEGLLWVAVPLLLLSYVAHANVKVFHPRYAAVAMPGFLLILAAGLADLGSRTRALFALAIAALWAVSLQHHYFVPRYGKEDMRAAAALIESRGGTGERVIAANSETVLVYYYRGPLPVRTIWIGDASNPDRLTTHLQAALAGARGAWVVLSRPEDLDPRDAFARYLDVRYPEAERFHFEGVRIWHFATSTAAPGGAVRGSPGS